MLPQLRLAADRQQGVFSAAQARAAGLAVGEIQELVRRGRWRRLHHGVYAEAPLVDALAALPLERHLLDCAAVQLALRRPFLLSSWSALRFHELATLGDPPCGVHGTDEGQWRTGKGYQISGAVVPPAHVVEREGWRVTSVARTAVDVARELSFTGGVVAADSALRRGATREELTRVALDCRHYEGIGRAVRACLFADPGAESVLESVSRVRLVALGLPAPSLQAEVYDGNGFIGRTDMWWAALRVAGEVDGRIKYTQPYADRDPDEILWREKLRMQRMETAGLEVVRWTNNELRQAPQAIVDRIRAASARAEHRPAAYRIVLRGESLRRAS